MTLRARPMQPKDVHECVEIITAHPVIGRRYRRGVNDLCSAWRRLLDSEAMAAEVYEEVSGATIRTCGFGVGVFVREDFMRELKTPPLFWIGPELARRVIAGTSPVLSDREVREANSSEGLNLIVWEGFPRPEFSERPDLHNLMIERWRQSYRGYLLKEMIASQMESAPRLQWALDTGGRFWDPAKTDYVKTPTKSAEESARDPHIVGITRKLELGRLGSWVGTLFDYQPPRFGFSRSEQRLLQAALAGESGTDEELSEALGVSVPTIKKMWLSIYRRVIDSQPEAIRDSAPVGATERGKEKRRHLLTYLREHPEELRPVSQKRLRQQLPVTERNHRVSG